MPKKNKLMHLNDHLFEQLERLNDDDLSGGALEKEAVRAKAMVAISSEITKISGQQIAAAKLMANSGDRHAASMPLIIVQPETPKVIAHNKGTP